MLKVPLWIAPNLITIIGLLVNISTSLVLMYYDPDAKGTHMPPRWTYLLCALGLFVYQSLDAIGNDTALIILPANSINAYWKFSL